jgi:hypothetical protein
MAIRRRLFMPPVCEGGGTAFQSGPAVPIPDGFLSWKFAGFRVKVGAALKPKMIYVFPTGIVQPERQVL